MTWHISSKWRVKSPLQNSSKINDVLIVYLIYTLTCHLVNVKVNVIVDLQVTPT